MVSDLLYRKEELSIRLCPECQPEDHSIRWTWGLKTVILGLVCCKIRGGLNAFMEDAQAKSNLQMKDRLQYCHCRCLMVIMRLLTSLVSRRSWRSMQVYMRWSRMQ